MFNYIYDFLDRLGLVAAPRPLQEIFNIAIENKFYLVGGYMCNALEYAEKEKKITRKEMKVAKAAIREYIQHLAGDKEIGDAAVLSWYVGFKTFQYPDRYTKCMQIYKDWANRPMKENNA